MKELKCFKSFNNYFPSSYFTESLSSDVKALGLNGESLKVLKKEIEKDLLSLVEEMDNIDIRTSVRRNITEKIYTALGYYNIELAPKFQNQRELIIKSNKVLVPIERAVSFLGEGELWLLSHAPELGLQQLENFYESEAETKSEFMFNEPTPTVFKNKPSAESLKDVIDAIFDGDQTDCESLIISSGDKLYLLERGKWQEGPQSYVELNLVDLYVNINDNSYYTMAEVLFSPKAFPIFSAENFHEELERNSHKKAAEVTKALRDTVRESIEILADEVLRQHQEKPISTWKKRDFKNQKDRNDCSQELFDQTLKYIYRMLFMLFTESKEQAKGSLPVHSKAYQKGYSIEKLRDLELKIFLASEAENSQSHFIQDTLNRAFKIYYQGYNNNKKKTKTDAMGFSFPSLGTHLFNPDSTPIYKEVTLPDTVLQKVIQKMSLAKIGSGKNIKQHRVHYAGLGLNQLGAVYEGLLTLKPEILSEKVVLLAKEKKEAAHRFIPFSQKNKVAAKQFATDDRDNILTKEKGSFLLTPVGLERKFSASFYTPEVLTRFLAKESVDTLLGENPTLERMENLKILEPAMGSGAFLNAVVDEIAPRMAKLYEEPDKKAYEEAIDKLSKQDKDKNPIELEKIKNLKPKPFNYYIAKAKKHLMVHAVHGVDLNPTAVELAKISLWLNCLHDDGNLPFLDMKLRLGNSLVGAWVNRHQDKDTDLPHWFFPNPVAIDPHLNGTILGDKKRPFISDNKEKERLKNIQSEWNKLKRDETTIKELQNLNKVIQKLYQTHLKLKNEYQNKIRGLENPIEKEQLFNQYIDENKAYNQLRAMMDYWCSLWFWPHEELKHLPSAKEFLKALNWLAQNPLSYGPKQKEELAKSNLKSLEISRRTALDTKFFHYDLEFADIFDQGGFDLCLGNPPWAPVRWEEADFFELHSPGIHDLPGDAREKYARYEQVLKKHEILVQGYVFEKTKAEGFSNFLKNSNTYTFNDKSQANTYRYFYQRFYQSTKDSGIHSMIAQDGILSDKGCIEMRPTFFREAISFFRFKNELNLFEDVHHEVYFIIWVEKKNKKNIEFKIIDNLYHPDTIEKCKKESPNAEYRGMKDSFGKFELKGHPKRIVTINNKILEKLANFSDELTAENTQLPIIHGLIELEILTNLASHPLKINKREWKFSPAFHEAQSPKKGLIKRKPGRSSDIKLSVMTGPNIFVANPARKKPKPNARHNLDFDHVDLNSKTQCPDNFFPDTVYQATDKGLKSNEYLTQTQWGEILSDQYRIISRQMVSRAGERTLASAIIPPGPTHVNAMSTLGFKTNHELVYTSGLFHSLFFDFLSRTISGGMIGQGILSMFPTLTEEQLKSPLVDHLKVRTLRLNSISTYYNDLWKDQFTESFKKCEIESSFKPTLPYSKLTNKWVRDTCIRDSQQRDQALCEIDAIVALLFDFDKETLLNLYRSQFGVLQKNLQDLPNQTPDSEKYHFPRYQAMSEAYDQFAKLIGKKGKVVEMQKKRDKKSTNNKKNKVS